MRANGGVVCVSAIGLFFVLGTIGCEGDRGPAGTVPPSPSAGLALTINKVSVNDQHHQVVEFTLTDTTGVPRTSLDGVTSNWTLAQVGQDPSTGLAVWDSELTTAVAGKLGTVNQPTSDSKGTYQALDEGKEGRFRYTFAAPLSQNDASHATHRLAVFSRLALPPSSGTPGHPPDVSSANGDFAVANAVFDFVPAGGTPAPFDMTVTEACNQCHAPLQAHGGFRRDEHLCVTCHTPQLFDPDTEDPALPGTPNSLDMGVLVHRLHYGKQLPTLVAAQKAKTVGVKYSVVGFQNNEIVFAQTSPPLKGTGDTPLITGIGFPQDIRNCTVCHQNAPQAGDFVNRVTRHACASCHEATWFGDPAQVPALHHEHPAGPAQDDASCRTCHPASGREFDLSIIGAHVVPLQSTQLAGLAFEILKVESGAPGAQAMAGTNPVVQFRVLSKGQPVSSLSQFDVLALLLSGPTTDYLQENMIRQDVRMGAVSNGDGTWSYTFKQRAANDPFFPGGTVIADTAHGTFAIGMEGRRAVTLTGDGTVEEAAFNPVLYFSVDGSPVVKRRAVIEQARCDRCHRDLSAHGNLRHNVEYCVICHGPDLTDWVTRPKGAGGNVDLAKTVDGIEERSVHLKRMIHSLHTGENLEVSQPYIIYGFGNSPNDFGDIRFPGDRRLCITCHVDTTFTVNAIPSTALPTIANETATILHAGTVKHVPGEPVFPVVQSACLTCHDSTAAHAHAALNTVMGVETCIVCHGEGRQDAVTTRHRTQ